MPFTHNYGYFTVVGSISYFLKNNLLTNTPTWLTPVTGQAGQNTLNFDFPEQPLVFPSFALTHLGSEEMVGMTFQGDRADGTNKGIQRWGMSEINCWVQSKDNSNWAMHLRIMRDMVFKLFSQNRAIQLYDLSNVPTVGAALGSVVRLMPGRGVREMQVAPDPNPAVKRSRILLTYFWTERF